MHGHVRCSPGPTVTRPQKVANTMCVSKKWVALISRWWGKRGWWNCRSATQNRGRQAAHCSTSSPWTRGSHGLQVQPVLVKGVLLVSTVQAPSKSKKHASTLSSTASTSNFYRGTIPCCERFFHPGPFSVQTKNQGPARARISSGTPQGLEF